MKFAFLITLMGLQVSSIFAESAAVTNYPKVDSHSWKTAPGGIMFINSLHQQAPTDEKKTGALTNFFDVRSFDLSHVPVQTIMQQAVDNDNPLFLQVLIDNKNDIQVKDDHGQSLLHLTKDNETTEQLKILLDAGLNPNQGDTVGITPLHSFLNLIIVKPKKKQFAQKAIALLISRGADIHAVGKFGVSPWQMVNWKKDGSLVFGADTLKIFITTVSPQEVLYAKKGATQKEELIQSKLAAAKEFLPIFSPRKDALRAEIEKNLTNAYTR